MWTPVRANCVQVSPFIGRIISISVGFEHFFLHIQFMCLQLIVMSTLHSRTDDPKEYISVFLLTKVYFVDCFLDDWHWRAADLPTRVSIKGWGLVAPSCGRRHRGGSFTNGDRSSRSTEDHASGLRIEDGYEDLELVQDNDQGRRCAIALAWKRNECDKDRSGISD